MKPDFKKRSLIKSFKNAFHGLWFCIKNERNMRIHTVMTMYVVIFAPLLGVNRAEYALLLITISLTITAEILNTAVEKLCDFHCKNYNFKIGEIKDICAAAVVLSAIFAVIIGLVVLFRPLKILSLLQTIFTSHLYIFLLTLSLVISILYIIKGPNIIYKKKD